MDIQIVDLKQRLKSEYKIDKNLVFYKEFNDYVILFLPDYKGKLCIFKYYKEFDNFILKEEIELDDNLKRNFIEINYYSEESIVYAVYTMDEIYIYRNNKIKSELIYSGEFDDFIILNKNYGLVKKEDIYYLLNLETKNLIEAKSNIPSNTLLTGTRMINLEGKDYLVHTSYDRDSYDCEYEFDRDEDLPISRVYIIDFEELIESVKNKEKIEFKIIKESNIKNSYINPVIYDMKVEKEEHKNNYHFYEINLEEKKLYLYNIVAEGNEVSYKEETVVDYSEYQDSYNLYATGYPVRIEKLTELFVYEEQRIFYPEDLKIKIENTKESFIDIVDDNLMFHRWDEPAEGIYFDGIRFRDMETNKVTLDLYRDGKLLSDKKTLVVYEEIYIQTSAVLIRGGDRTYTKLNDIFEGIDNSHKEYNWLLSNMEVSVLNNEALDEDLNNREYLFLTGEELDKLINENDIQFIWGIITGFDKNRTEEEVVEECIPQIEGFKGYWDENISLQHGLSIIEIVACDSSYVIVVSDEDEIIKSMDKHFEEAVDLAYDNKIINSQMEYIKNVLTQDGKIQNMPIQGLVIDIWYKLFKPDYLNPYINVSEDKILAEIENPLLF